MTFHVRAQHRGSSIWLDKGDAVSVEFSGGKGVSARVAEVHVQDGGSRFLIECTDSGEPRTVDGVNVGRPDRPQQGTQYEPAVPGVEFRFSDEGVSVREADDDWSDVMSIQQAVELGFLRPKAMGTFTTRTNSPQFAQDGAEGDGEASTPSNDIDTILERLTARNRLLVDRVERQHESITQLQRVNEQRRSEVHTLRTANARQSRQLRDDNRKLADLDAKLQKQTRERDHAREVTERHWRALLGTNEYVQELIQVMGGGQTIIQERDALKREVEELREKAASTTVINIPAGQTVVINQPPEVPF